MATSILTMLPSSKCGAVLAAILIFVCGTLYGAETPKYILFLTADGFRTDYIQWYHPTNLLQLIDQGVRIQNAKNVFPTVTTPNMTSLITGSYPRTTGIAANSQYLKEEDRIEKSPRGNRAETIGETLQKAGWKTAGINHFMLQDRGADFYSAPGYDDSEKTTQAILSAVQSKGARFVGAIYGATDHAGHAHGPRSEQVKQAVLEIDHAIGRLIAGLKEQGIFEQTVIVFASDHGMSSFESKQVSVEPAKALRAAGFRVASSQPELKENTQVIVLDAGVRLVYFRQVSNEERQRATAVLSGIEGAEVLDRTRLDTLGCHDNRSGDLIVSPLPGFTISHAGRNGGLHGRFAERNPILFFYGPGFRQGVVVDSAETIDVVPTLLRLVDVPPARTVDGKVIGEALRN